MIRLKVFISSVQKELKTERIAIAGFLSTDVFLSECTVPRIFEDYPQPLRPNPKAYLDLLRQCQIYLLIIGSEYGNDAGDGLSATHEEYRLAQELKLPTLVCIKGSRDMRREEAVHSFLREVSDANHIYSRFDSEERLLSIVDRRLREHIEVTYDTVRKRFQEEQFILTRQSASAFERKRLERLDYNDLDTDLALDMITAAEDKEKERIHIPELPRLLLSRGYLWKDNDNFRPTIACALLLARSPSIELPQARVQMDAWPGSDRDAEPLDSIFLDDPLSHIVEKAVSFIRRNTPRPLVIKGIKRQNIETYPQEVLREAIVNALAHRDYSDPGAKITVEVFSNRVCVSSPGHPPGNQSVERLSSGEALSRLRNPLVVQGLNWLEIMDERGSGIRRMTRILLERGHPRPIYRIDHDCLVLEIRPSETFPNTDSEIHDSNYKDSGAVTVEHTSPKEEILDELSGTGSITTRRCVQKFGISRDTAWRILSELVKDGRLTREGSGRSTIYRLAERKQ